MNIALPPPKFSIQWSESIQKVTQLPEQMHINSNQSALQSSGSNAIVSTQLYKVQD